MKKKIVAALREVYTLAFFAWIITLVLIPIFLCLGYKTATANTFVISFIPFGIFYSGSLILMPIMFEEDDRRARGED